MKLATIKSKRSRDGILCVVSRDLNHAVLVPNLAQTLKIALDNWEHIQPRLDAIYQALNSNKLDNIFTFDPRLATAPLPRAYQWADGSAYVNHVELVRKARGADMPDKFWTDPLMYQGGSDCLLGACEDIAVADISYGIDFEAEVAIITDDVNMGTAGSEAQRHIKLLMLVNDVSLRNLIPDELAKGFGFFQSKPASSFSPVAITPDELGANWDGARIHLPLVSHLNSQIFGRPNAGVDMIFSFPDLIAHAAKTRFLSAGTIIGSGTVSNLDRSHGSSCIVEKRTLEMLEHGKAITNYMQFGDNIRIEMLDEHGRTLFGAIEQRIIQYQPGNQT